MKGKILYLLDFIYAIVLSVFLLVTMIIYTHTKTVDLRKTCSDAEIVIAAAGRAKMLNSDYCGQDAVMIDVGINVDENGKLCGDVDYATLDGKASAATPVPGGVGTVTTAVLAKHLIQAAKMR